MKIFRSLSEISADFGPVVATIGNFDGVHRGHQWVMERVTRRAHELGLRSLAVTFDPHPARVLHPEKPHALITTMPQKLNLLAATGVAAVAGSAFFRPGRGENLLRFCFAKKDHDLDEACDRLRKL